MIYGKPVGGTVGGALAATGASSLQAFGILVGALTLIAAGTALYKLAKRSRRH